MKLKQVMDPQRLLKRFSDITVWKQGGQRAPHKPLLGLYAIGKMLQGEGRLIPYADIDRDLKKLLIEFGPTRKSYHPEYPYWCLLSIITSLKPSFSNGKLLTATKWT